MPLSTTPNGTGNRLLDRLPRKEYKNLLPQLETISLAQEEEVCHQYSRLSHVYFPTNGVFSTVIRMVEGERIAATAIGKEGMVGVEAVLGLDFSPITTVPLVPGECLRLPVPSLSQVVKPGRELDELLRRYAAYSLRNAQQSVACNALHSVEERMCRWLLMTQDRAGKDEFEFTHELLAATLGVRRQSVSVVAGTLQEAGFSAYRRGVMRIVGRAGLEAASCGCYRVTETLYDRIMQPFAESLN
jgi:CRP-like cAMP-binding protein